MGREEYCAILDFHESTFYKSDNSSLMVHFDSALEKGTAIKAFSKDIDGLYEWWTRKGTSELLGYVDNAESPFSYNTEWEKFPRLSFHPVLREDKSIVVRKGIVSIEEIESKIFYDQMDKIKAQDTGLEKIVK